MPETSPGQGHNRIDNRTIAEQLSDRFMRSFVGPIRSGNGTMEFISAIVNPAHPIRAEDDKTRESAKRAMRRLLRSAEVPSVDKLLKSLIVDLAYQEKMASQLPSFLDDNLADGSSLSLYSLRSFGQGYYKATQDIKAVLLIDEIMNMFSEPDPEEMSLILVVQNLMTVFQAFYLIGCQVELFTEQTQQTLESLDFDLWSPMPSECGAGITSSRYMAISWLIDLDSANVEVVEAPENVACIAALARLKGPLVLNKDNAAYSDMSPESLPVDMYLKYFAGTACIQRTHVILRHIQLIDAIQRSLLVVDVKQEDIIAVFDAANQAALEQRQGYQIALKGKLVTSVVPEWVGHDTL